ncbi:hypothetical protein PsYK624_129090 [Phanerochaete sordida]|uniref:Uncharacterized protein n=1 Tax=Phanerochaete sordida TaxID=48140 RepID=A0A9P3GM12_9APHY|nr:hypothetical protein PsYK624_129090 [Phanerochaete sordida]
MRDHSKIQIEVHGDISTDMHKVDPLLCSRSGLSHLPRSHIQACLRKPYGQGQNCIAAASCNASSDADPSVCSALWQAERNANSAFGIRLAVMSAKLPWHAT